MADRIRTRKKLVKTNPVDELENRKHDWDAIVNFLHTQAVNHYKKRIIKTAVTTRLKEPGNVFAKLNNR